MTPSPARKSLAYIPDNPDLYEFLSGIQYLNFVADIFGVSQDETGKAAFIATRTFLI